LADLTQLGFEVLPAEHGKRVVRYGGKTFVDNLTLMDEMNAELNNRTTGAGL
jgi:hypothetical protein